MKPSLHIRALALLSLSAVALLWPAIGRTQAPGNGGAEAVVPEKPRLNLDIRQGLLDGRGNDPATIARVVEVIHAQAPDANFVLSPGVADIVVSNLTLRSADLEGALAALEFATGRKVLARQVARDNIYAVTPGQTAKPEKSVEVFNLMPILRALAPGDPKEVRECLTEISTVIVQTITEFDRQTGSDRGKPLLNFNESTRLLVVIGHPEQLEIAHKIIKALTPPAGSGLSIEPPRPEPRLPGGAPQSRSPSDAEPEP